VVILDVPLNVFDKFDNFVVYYCVELNAPIVEDITGGAELLLTLAGWAKRRTVKTALVIRAFDLWVLTLHHATP
jgi:hypothetical protein